jgi:3-hydroxybutyryl-CoA dehydrogenase
MAEGRSIHRIGICGIGQMGAAAAVVFKRGGYEVLLWGRNSRKLDAVKLTLVELEEWMERHVGPALQEGGVIVPVNELRRIDGEADLVMDCIAEEMNQKVELFQGLIGARQRGAIFITTTSGLSITEIGRRSGCAELVAGTHFWNPPHLMPLVEVIRGEDTPDTVMDRVCEVVESIGKIPVRVNRDVPGFIGNRMLHALWREAIYLVQEGIAGPEDIDMVARLTFGLRMPVLGPLENMDLVGLDLIDTIHSYMLASLSSDRDVLPALRERTEHDEMGIKSGKGFYDWSDRDASELIERRDAQIVRQLNYLKETGAL